MSPSERLSIDLQAIAERLNTMLEQTAEQPCSFVLVIQTDGTAQYVSNLARSDGKDLLESLFQRWIEGRADIPAHYNPDLRSINRR